MPSPFAHGDRVDIYHCPSLSLLVPFSMATYDEHAKEPVRDLPIDGIFIVVEVDLTSDSINEGILGG